MNPMKRYSSVQYILSQHPEVQSMTDLGTVSGSELAKRLGIGKSTARRYLQNLREHGLENLHSTPRGESTQRGPDGEDRIIWSEYGVETFLNDDYGWVRFTLEEHEGLLKDYSRHHEGKSLNQDQISIKYPKLVNAHAVALYVKLHGIRQTSIPVPVYKREEITPEQAAKETAESWENRYFRELREQQRKQDTEAANKWRRIFSEMDLFLERANVRPLEPMPKVKLSSGSNPFAAIIGISDLHLGKLVYDAFGQVVYDRKIAREKMLSHLVRSVSKIQSFGVPDTVYLPISSDGLQVDNGFLTTTRGTPMAGKTDGTYTMMLEEYTSLMEECLHLLSGSFKHVVAVNMPGNHDFNSGIWMGKYLNARFANHMNVDVLSNPYQFHILENYGDCSLLFHHGDKSKLSELPSLFREKSREQKVPLKNNLISISGHLHHHSTVDQNGIDRIILSSLAPKDSYEDENGYFSRSQSTVHIIHPVTGLSDTALIR